MCEREKEREKEQKSVAPTGSFSLWWRIIAGYSWGMKGVEV